MKHSNWVRIAFLLAVTLLFSGCIVGTGACVSDPVSYTFGLRVYCYSDYSAQECSDYDSMSINGAGWTFYGGQTCDDRGFVEGSNPYP